MSVYICADTMLPSWASLSSGSPSDLRFRALALTLMEIHSSFQFDAIYIYIYFPIFLYIYIYMCIYVLGRKTLCINISVYPNIIIIYLSIYLHVFAAQRWPFSMACTTLPLIHSLAKLAVLLDTVVHGHVAATMKYVNPAHLHDRSWRGIACTGVGASMLLFWCLSLNNY